jgi:hypothetical protein
VVPSLELPHDRGIAALPLLRASEKALGRFGLGTIERDPHVR